MLPCDAQSETCSYAKVMHAAKKQENETSFVRKMTEAALIAGK
jgi:hypothetical protein